jgi:hypothetical protein
MYPGKSTCSLQKYDYFTGFKFSYILIVFNTFGLESTHILFRCALFSVED